MAAPRHSRGDSSAMSAAATISQASIVRFHDFIRGQPCQHCGAVGATELAHYDANRAGQFGKGMGRKPTG